MNFSLSEIEKIENDLRQKYSLFRQSIDSLRELIDSLSLYWKSDDTNNKGTVNERCFYCFIFRKA